MGIPPPFHGPAHTYGNRSFPQPRRPETLDSVGYSHPATGRQCTRYRHPVAWRWLAELSALSPSPHSRFAGDAFDGLVGGSCGAAGRSQAGAVDGGVFRGADRGGVTFIVGSDQRLRHSPVSTVLQPMVALGPEQPLGSLDFGRVSILHRGTGVEPAGWF